MSYFIFCRHWPGFTDAFFQSGEFINLPEAEVVDAVKHAVAVRLTGDPKKTAEWERRKKFHLQLELSALLAPTTQQFGIEPVRDWYEQELERRMENDLPVALRAGLELVGWLTYNPLESFSIGSFQPRHLITTVEEESRARDITDALAKRYRQLPDVTTFGYFDGNACGLSDRLLCSEAVSRVTAALLDPKYPDLTQVPAGDWRPFSQRNIPAQLQRAFLSVRPEVVQYAKTAATLLEMLAKATRSTAPSASTAAPEGEGDTKHMVSPLSANQDGESPAQIHAAEDVWGIRETMKYLGMTNAKSIDRLIEAGDLRATSSKGQGRKIIKTSVLDYDQRRKAAAEQAQKIAKEAVDHAEDSDEPEADEEVKEKWEKAGRWRCTTKGCNWSGDYRPDRSCPSCREDGKEGKLVPVAD